MTSRSFADRRVGHGVLNRVVVQDGESPQIEPDMVGRAKAQHVRLDVRTVMRSNRRSGKPERRGRTSEALPRSGPSSAKRTQILLTSGRLGE